MDIIISCYGTLYHREEYAAPYGFRRPAGERVDLWGLEGKWVRIIPDQSIFVFSAKEEGEVVIIESGFTNTALNGATLPIQVLTMGNDAELKAAMKECGLPSCTRKNLLKDFLRWYFLD